MMPRIAGIDPGKSGAAAIRYRFNSEDEVYCAPLPGGEGEIVVMLTELFKLGPDDVVYIEQVSGFIGKEHPGSRMFTFGMNYGILLGALECTKCRIVKVRPQAWQKGLGLGSRGSRSRTEWKRHLKEEAKRLWPGERITLTTADAYLILAYALKKEKNQKNSTNQDGCTKAEAVPAMEES